MDKQKRSRYYLGENFKIGLREIFRSVETPRQEDHPKYQICVGPFRTKRGAIFMRDYGSNNPHCQHVNDAERLGKIYATKMKEESVKTG